MGTYQRGRCFFSEDSYVIFDDTVLEKRNTKKIEIARNQYSGAKGKVTKGIGGSKFSILQSRNR